MRLETVSTALWIALLASGAGCALVGPTGESVGLPHDGYLRGGEALPDRGVGFVRARPGEDTRYGTSRLVASLVRAAAQVAAAHPGTPPLRVGDLGARDGGAHPRHASHRAGRDVDLAFFLTDVVGTPIPSRAASFDRHGVAEADGALVRFDAARNWSLVRALLTDPTVDVAYIFCSHGVRAMLLRYAALHEPSAEVLSRARHVLHQPSQARSHDDHFHVRIACTADERALACRDGSPTWAFLRDERAPDAPMAPEDDAAVLAYLRE